MIKKLFLVIFISFLNNCGYEPLYTNKGNSLIKFNSINTLGDEKINKKIISLTRIEKKQNNSSLYSLLIDSKKNREVLAKDKSGNVTSYKISLKVTLSVIDTIDNEKVIKSKDFNSSYTYKNAENKFQLSQDEKNIINNLIESSVQKIIIFLNS
tara:strand:- start:151 stop:612 length:462 start_codon:yes stop_codon:yes gene_type:complete